MPKARLSMRKIKELLRLHLDHKLSLNQSAKACGMARSTAQEYVKRFRDSDLPWPLPPDIDGGALNDKLFVQPPNPDRGKPLPDWSSVHKELSKKGVTLKLLWEEYRQKFPDGYSYSQFLRHYRAWSCKLNVTMRQHHKAGEKLFVDFAGQTMEVIDPDTGEVSHAQIFVATLGFSNFSFAYALPSQTLEDWIDGHNRALRYFGGAPAVVVPDNLKSGVRSPCRYEPDLNPTYQEWAEHYNVAVIPARVRKPRDKAKVETGVQVVERRGIAPLRNRRFFSIEEINKALKLQIAMINDRLMPKLGVSRRELFNTVEREALRYLPSEDFEPGIWRKAKVHLDYHVEVDRHYYSVPYTFVRKNVEIRTGKRTIEVYHEGRRIASHKRSHKIHQHTTCTDHMPQAHQEASGWDPVRFLAWAEKIGPASTGMVKTILKSRKHPEQGFRSCLGLLRLENRYGRKRLEKACERALFFNLMGRRPVLEILRKKQDMLELPVEEDIHLFTHTNVRGAEFYR